MLGYAGIRAPVGAWTSDALLDRPAGEYLPAAATAALSAEQRAAVRREAAAQHLRTRQRQEIRAASSGPLSGGTAETAPGTGIQPRAVPLDVSAASTAVVAALDPLPAVRARLLARVPALAALAPPGLALPVLHPVFPDPVSADLARLDARYLLPGADSFPENRVSAVVADDDFVATLLVGANAEMSRELLWREYPTSPSATFFTRFWETGAGGPGDITDIAGWHGARPGAHVVGVGAADLTVMLVRGDVVRRYPEMHVYAARAVWDGDTAVPDESDTREPVLLGALDRATRFYGIPVRVRDLRGHRFARPRTAQSAGWFVALEEPARGPRFGLDEPTGDGADTSTMPATWDGLTWGHLAPPGGDAADVAFAVARVPIPQRPGGAPAGAVWGRNAAHIAAITYQRPYRVMMHADLLLPAR